MQDLGGGPLGQGLMTSLCSFNRAKTFVMKMFMANMKYEYQKGRQIITTQQKIFYVEVGMFSG